MTSSCSTKACGACRQWLHTVCASPPLFEFATLPPCHADRHADRATHALSDRLSERSASRIVPIVDRAVRIVISADDPIPLDPKLLHHVRTLEVRLPYKDTS